MKFFITLILTVACAGLIAETPEEIFESHKKGAEENVGDDKFKQSVQSMVQWLLAVEYITGKGVAKNEAEGVKWLRKSAEFGQARSQCDLAHCYMDGTGVKIDYNEGVKWYRKAAEQGYIVAQNRLGRCYYLGTGVSKDYSESAKWFHKAADRGDDDSQGYLAMLYYNGMGVSKDYIKAYAYANLAAATNDDARQLLNEIEQNVSPAIAEKGQQLTRELKVEISKKQQ